MTIKVTVETPSGVGASVTVTGNPPVTMTPGSVQDFYAHSAAAVLVEELIGGAHTNDGGGGGHGDPPPEDKK